MVARKLHRDWKCRGGGLSQTSVLIVEDNHDMADVLGLLLEDEGYQVTLAYNGNDGIYRG